MKRSTSTVDQNDFSNDILKYLWILIAFFSSMFLLSFLSPFILRSIAEGERSAADFEAALFIFLLIRVVLGIVFGLILYLDCRKDIKNKYLVPLLGIVSPIVGTGFYFIEKYLATKTFKNDN